MTTPIALVGIGKIARDAHVPTIAASPDFTLVAAVTRHGPPDGIPAFTTIAEMMAALPDVAAVSLCTPPQGRLALIAEAFDHGLDVMMEKPPATTLSEAETISQLAAKAGKIAFVTWHSREAAGVEPARAWLARRTIRRVQANWLEDVRIWHPGQDWIWQPGIGVFDAGINALSVLTHILPQRMVLQDAELRFPQNRAAPIAASLRFSDADGTPIAVELDFDRRGPQHWDIDIETDDGTLRLTKGASKVAIDESDVTVSDDPEYARLYCRFAQLLQARESDIDLGPLRHVADAFMLGRRVTVGPFDDASAREQPGRQTANTWVNLE